MNKQLPLPQSIEAFIQATNRHDTDEFLATLTDEAVITDEGRCKPPAITATSY